MTSDLLCVQERTATLSALAEKAKLTEQVLNTVDGIRCNPVQGAMYSFPRIAIPEKAIKEATVSPAALPLKLMCCRLKVDVLMKIPLKELSELKETIIFTQHPFQSSTYPLDHFLCFYSGCATHMTFSAQRLHLHRPKSPGNEHGSFGSEADLGAAQPPCCLLRGTNDFL